MSSQEKFDIESSLRQVGVFNNASDDDIRTIAQLGIPRSIEPGSYFFFEGDPANYLYILLSGRAKLCQITTEGQQVNLRTLSPNQLFGAIGAIDAQATYPACAQALEDSTALAIESAAFRKLLEQRPHLSFGMMRLMTGYIREMQSRFSELATARVEQRIARTLLRLAGQLGRMVDQGLLVELPFSRQELAEMNGTTLYTVSRTLSAWEKTGMVTTGRGRVVITNPHALVRLAEGLE
ncbi:MAG: Crp/Fnr family transcriptional regulator [Anaerolineales bacterium]|nr:Crp/Fnr family transcriptional regulator [Anaerolineales bacterium]